MECKACTKCGETKPLTEFYKRTRAKDGHSAYCKQCAKRDWFNAQNTGLKETRARYYKANKTKINAQRLKNSHTPQQKNYRRALQLKCKYVLTVAEFETMRDVRDDKCDICKADAAHPNRNGKVLCVDHCHTTGEVRGLLCDPCNTAIGNMRDSPDILRNAIAYLEKHQ